MLDYGGFIHMDTFAQCLPMLSAVDHGALRFIAKVLMCLCTL